MRIISQNGIADIPYDLYGVRQLSSNLSKIIAFNNSDEYLVMAEYSSVEKAKKAMEMLRNAYVGLPILFQNVDMNESVVEKLKEWKRDGIVLLHDNADSKIEQVNNAIFKFPTDEEVEV